MPAASGASSRGSRRSRAASEAGTPASSHGARSSGGGSSSSSVRRPMMSEEAVAGHCPPWSTPLKSTVRVQDTTLAYTVKEVSPSLAAAQERLNRRRYQPTSSDHGFVQRLQ